MQKIQKVRDHSSRDALVYSHLLQNEEPIFNSILVVLSQKHSSVIVKAMPSSRNRVSVVVNGGRSFDWDMREPDYATQSETTKDTIAALIS